MASNAGTGLQPPLWGRRTPRRAPQRFFRLVRTFRTWHPNPRSVDPCASRRSARGSAFSSSPV